jgi:hypothetical protein
MSFFLVRMYMGIVFNYGLIWGLKYFDENKIGKYGDLKGGWMWD